METAFPLIGALFMLLLWFGGMFCAAVIAAFGTWLLSAGRRAPYDKPPNHAIWGTTPPQRSPNAQIWG